MSFNSDIFDKLENLVPVIAWHLNVWWIKYSLNFDSYSKHIQGKPRKWWDLPSAIAKWHGYQDSQLSQWWLGRNLGTQGGGSKHGQFVWGPGGQEERRLDTAGQGLPWPFLSGSLSPSHRLQNMFWKLFPEGTRSSGDSLFLDSRCKCPHSDGIQGCVSRPTLWLVAEF